MLRAATTRPRESATAAATGRHAILTLAERRRPAERSGCAPAGRPAAARARSAGRIHRPRRVAARSRWISSSANASSTLPAAPARSGSGRPSWMNGRSSWRPSTAAMQIRVSCSRMYRWTLSPIASRRRRITGSATARRSKVSAAASPQYSSRGPSEYRPSSVLRTIPRAASSFEQPVRRRLRHVERRAHVGELHRLAGLAQASISSLAFSRTDMRSEPQRLR